MVVVIASITVKVGKRAEFLEILKKNVPRVLVEDGCLEYLPTVDRIGALPIQQRDDDVVTIVEKWRDVAALAAHLESPHMLDYRKNVRELVEDVAIKVLEQA